MVDPKTKTDEELEEDIGKLQNKLKRKKAEKLGLQTLVTRISNRIDEIQTELNLNKDELEHRIQIKNRSLIYDSTSFIEKIANDGAVETTIDINIVKDIFTGSKNDDFIVDGKATITNIPTGLTPELKRKNKVKLVLKLNGKATDHEANHSVSDIVLTFNDSAFELGQADIIEDVSKNLTLLFTDAPVITYSATIFEEAAANDGSIENTIDITLLNEVFTGVNSDDFALDNSKVNIKKVPKGLTASLIRNSDTSLTLSLLGTANKHKDNKDVNDLTVDFKNGAFSVVKANDIINASKSDLQVNFNT